MKRFWRIFFRGLFAGIALLSLVLCFLAVYFWIRSHHVAEVIYLKPMAASGEQAKPLPAENRTWQYQYHFGSCAGKLQMVRRHLQVGTETAPRVMHLNPTDPAAMTTLTPRDPLDLHWKFGGLDYFHSDRRYFKTGAMTAWVWGFVILTVPYWMLVLLTAISPAIFAVRLVRRRRQERRLIGGLCVHCGYDLRASSGNCPECGAAIKAI